MDYSIKLDKENMIKPISINTALKLVVLKDKGNSKLAHKMNQIVMIKNLIEN